MSKKHPNPPLYHTKGKKSIEKAKSVEKSIKSCGKDVENLCKTTPKPVDNLCKTSNKFVDNSQDTVKKTTEIVDNSTNSGGEPVQNRQEDVEKSQNSAQKSENFVQNSSKQVENSSKSMENSQQPFLKSQEPTSRHPESPKTRIKVTNVHKQFRLPTERASGLKQAILNWFKGIKGYTEHEVLKGISFEVKDGEFLGIVGRNGSGKSTLLKLLAQIYYPEKGTITVDGTLVPFIELGVGFNPELTGRENVFLNGALLGFSHQEMESMYDEIVQFAELEQFMDAKLKNYSSGMQVRLAFSIAIRAKGDILILDEVLAVGDAEFQQKCNDYFASLHGQQTVILVTHDMNNVRRFCDRAILIEDGKIMDQGNPEDVAKSYENLWK